MGSETIMLASSFDLKKAKFPLAISEKIDGVAANFYTSIRMGSTSMSVISRDNKPILSVPHLTEFLTASVKHTKGLHIIGELHIEGRDFKDISGIVRRKTPDDETELLRLHIYDMYIEGKENTDYIDRYDAILKYVPDLGAMVRRVPSYIVNNEDEFNERYAAIVKANSTKRPTGCEGVMVRTLRGEDSYYRVAKRPKGFAKLKAIETIDIPFLDFEEAIDKKTGEGLGMVGRIISKYNGISVGCGPGKLTHKERIRIFDEWPKDKGRMFEAAFMPDDSYDAMREPRFWHWRPDKD